ncbi:MAG: immunoglobulin domain-containing protein, partial [Bacteroidetes bacterium]|nr:immunoglobulin domain-containing protein [Bacteroidota bacterium]
MRNCVPIRSLLRTNIKLPGKNVPVFFSVFLILLPAVFNKSTGQSALTVDTLTYTPEQLVFNILVTGCTQAANVEFKGSSQAVGYFEYNGQDMEFRKGIILSGGYAASAVGQNDSGGHSEEFNGSGDEDLDSIIVPNITNDAAVIEFDFIPSSDSVWFRYVFASEEYPESVCQFNDVFGFFISGPGISGPYAGNAVNIALLPGTTTPVSINNVNNGKFNQPDFPGCPAQNPQYYVENGVGDTPGINADIQYDGYTVELIAKASVVPCETYHIKLAVADAVDTYSNSGVFLEAGSFTSGTIITVDHFGQGAQNNMLYEGCENYFVFTRGDTTDVSADLHFNLTFSGTAQNGVDYTGFPGAWFIPAGQISDTVFYSGVLDEADEGTETLIYTFETLGNCPCSSNPVTFTDTIYIYDNLTLEGGLSYSDSTVCYPDSTTLVIWHNLQEEIVSYTWSSGETSQVISVSPESPQYWYLTVSDVCGQSLTDSVLVILNYPAAFSPLSDTSICTGQDISITVDTTGTPPIELQWCGPTGLIPDATDDTLNIPSTTEDNEGGYWCLASNVCDIVSSDTMLLGIVTDPAIVSQPASDTVCENDSAHFVLSVNETVSFQWFGPAGIITDTDDSLLVIFPATFSDTGVYYCVVTNACSSDVSDTARLTVAS